ncbi:hypothetical protein [Kibdelosporangium philippinense]|uniref:hypothetical protein n=1 Tax=Kibdelosporangium philippinense TaxID=211113 RepID=UPI00361C351E
MVTDRGPQRDAIYHVEPGKPLGNAVWTWPDKQASPDASSLRRADGGRVDRGNMQNLPLNPEA